jgi:hypothetical protein
MENCIFRVEVFNGAVIPAAAEIWLFAEPRYVTPTTELRGRLMGPRCRFATTVEVAYPLRQVTGTMQVATGSAGFVVVPESSWWDRETPFTDQRSVELRLFAETHPGFSGLVGRAVIPEACLWDPESPFLYQGPVELWQDGRLCERVVVTHGVRRLSLGTDGLFVNGRRLALRGRAVTALTEAEALALREVGVNLLVAAVTAETASLWDLADRIGFLMLGRVVDFEAERDRVASLSSHASCLGWLVAPEDLPRFPGRCVGITPVHRDRAALPEGVRFVVGDPGLADLRLPLLVRGAAPPAGPGILGTIED